MKRKILFIVAMGLTAMAFTGCTNEETQKDTFRTIEFFNKNKDIRKVRIRECKDMKTMNEIIEKDCNNASISFSDEEHTKSRSKHIDYSKIPT